MKIKKLEWYQSGDSELIWADTPFGTGYSICEYRKPVFNCKVWTVDQKPKNIGNVTSIEQAKRICQKHFVKEMNKVVEEWTCS